MKIGHYADIQVKVRDNENHAQSYEANLKNIEKELENEQVDVVVIAGDLWEHYDVNDIERLIMYRHIANILQLPKVKEVVVMLGNHDLPSEKKVKEITRNSNPLDTLYKFLHDISPNLCEKLNYLKKQEPTPSKILPNDLCWLPYSLEDGKSNGNNIREIIENEGLTKFKKYITIYHDILIEYVDDSGLPINDTTRKRLCDMSMFHTSEIFAGDIHEIYHVEDEETGKKFWYPGSTQQRNYGEGCYFTVYQNKFDYKPADSKSILVYNYTDNLELDSVYYVMLEDYIRHITIDITKTQKRDDIVSVITDLISSYDFGTYQTFIKIKSSNIYLDEEINIINKLNEVLLDKPGITVIEPILYEKIINNKIAETNKVLEVLKSIESTEDLTDEEVKAREIINLDNIENLTTEHITENFENVLLNKPKLIKLFESLLEIEKPELIKILPPDVNIDEVISELITLFISEIEFAVDSTPNYKIKLKSIQTTGFMPLGENFIHLDIPGLARISSTNGRGKTSLYTMIYWTIRGKIYESLKDNQVVKNNLHIFNDEKPDNDNVINLLKIEVNDVPVSIKRFAIRKWKSKTTDEQKAAIDWRNYVSGVTTDIEVTFTNKGNEVKRTGEEAQELLRQWFGKVPETILFLNQPKIENLLNLNSDDLQKLTLDYIGIDYIKILINSLPSIKESMGVIRPKKTKAAIKAELDDLNSRNNFDEQEKFFEESIQENNKKLNSLKDDINLINSDLINLGNIPEKISSLVKEQTSVEQQINNFVKQTPKEIPIFEKVKPVKDDEKIRILELNLLSIENERKQQTDNKVKYSESISELDTKIDNIIDNSKKSLETIKTNLINESTEELEFLINDTEKNFNIKSANLGDKLKEVEEIIDKARGVINQVNVNVDILNKQIDSDTESLSSSVCSECGKPISENIEEHQKYISEKEDLIEKNKVKVQKLTELGETNTIIENDYSKLKILISTVLNFKNDQIVEPYFTMESTINSVIPNELLDNVKCMVLDYLSEYKHISELKESLSNINNVIPSNEGNLKLQNINEKLTKLDSLKLNISKRNFIDDETYRFGMIVIKGDLDELIGYCDRLSNIDNVINEITERYNDANNTLKDLLETYYKETSEYQTEYDEHLTEVTKVQEFNKNITEHNNKLNEYNTEYIRLQKEIDSNNLALPAFNELKVKLDLNNNNVNECTIVIEDFVSKKNNLLVEKQRHANQLEILNKEYKDYIEYEKNKAKYAIYEIIIAKKFKIAVFAYYRNFLNITFNILLQDLNFKLFWNEDGNLYYIKFNEGKQFTRPVQLVSGMETCFLGLALTYAIHTLNVKNNISHLFIDEISGQLNSGKNNFDEKDTINYQEQLLSLLSKFESKTIFIIDHVIKDMFQTVTYSINRKDNASYYEEV